MWLRNSIRSTSLTLTSNEPESLRFDGLAGNSAGFQPMNHSKQAERGEREPQGEGGGRAAVAKGLVVDLAIQGGAAWHHEENDRANHGHEQAPRHARAL